jgi:hypothetical protein
MLSDDRRSVWFWLALPRAHVRSLHWITNRRPSQRTVNTRWWVASGLSWAEFIVCEPRLGGRKLKKNVDRAYEVSVNPLIHSSHSEQHVARHDDSGRTKRASLEHLARDTDQTLDLGDRHVSFGATGVEKIRIARDLEPSGLLKMMSDILIGEDSAGAGV